MQGKDRIDLRPFRQGIAVCLDAHWWFDERGYTNPFVDEHNLRPHQDRYSVLVHGLGRVRRQAEKLAGYYAEDNDADRTMGAVRAVVLPQNLRKGLVGGFAAV